MGQNISRPLQSPRRRKTMLSEYVEAAMKKAKYKLLGGGEGYFGRIPGFRGVWSNADTLKAAKEELRTALEDWMLFRLREGMNLPTIAGINLNPRKLKRRKVA
jgi:predicted RNase H-like HicB family nuclease